MFYSGWESRACPGRIWSSMFPVMKHVIMNGPFQATNENIREFQEAVQKITTEEIANFTSGKYLTFYKKF